MLNYVVVSSSFATPWLLWTWCFAGKNTGLSCQFLLYGIFRPGDRTRVPCVGKPAPGYSGDQPEKSPFLCATRRERCWLNSIVERSYTFFFKVFIIIFILPALGLLSGAQSGPFCRAPALERRGGSCGLGLAAPWHVGC